MRLFRPGLPARLIYHKALFRLPVSEKVLCLTFDDGPDPESTPKIIDVLDSHEIKAMFFCNGQSAERYPELIALIRSKGHIIGNHGQQHLNGWDTSTAEYIENVKRASECTSSLLFRPPYGRMKHSQYQSLRKLFRIILWDIMPYDFDTRFGSDNSLEVLKRMTRRGSIIVLHDSQKSTVLSFLEKFIRHTSGQGYRFGLPEFL